ncbi:MAG: TIGR01777 family oxidoreductase [Bacteroidetes bacterium]|nr:TIGR01777 family oxidoreductase [Bacteroidota bacterium]
MGKTIGITGGTGLVGSQLSRKLVDAGYNVVVFSRSRESKEGRIEYALWNPEKKEIAISALSRLDGMVHLAGAGVADKRWTKQRKEEILRSRTDATDFIVESMKKYAPNCKVFVSASATGFYGQDRGGNAFVECDHAGNGFLADVCTRWEQAAQAADSFARVVIFRFGIVLAVEGGVIPKFLAPMKLGLAAVLGSGRQMLSWVHISDLTCMIKTALRQEQYSGVYNAVSPGPVSNKELVQEIARQKGGNFFTLAVPGFVLRFMLGAAAGEVLASCTASSSKLAAAGFVFQFPDIKTAVCAVLHHQAGQYTFQPNSSKS